MKGAILSSSKNLSFLNRIVKVLPQAIRNGLPADIAIVEVSEKESRRLNLIYRGRRKPANVLSFRYDHEYGEIIVCALMIRREAKMQKHSFKYQMTWMVVHGMIHLSGLHHEKSDAAAQKAERIEQAILRDIF